MTQATQEKAIPAFLKIDDEGVTVTLRHNANFSGVVTDKLKMRAPCLRDVNAAKAAANGDYEKMEMNLFCSLLTATEAELLSLKYVDYLRLQAGYFRLVGEDDV
ncbi:phage tail assembly protein [Pseudomonas sp. S2_B07]